MASRSIFVAASLLGLVAAVLTRPRDSTSGVQLNRKNYALCSQRLV